MTLRRTKLTSDIAAIKTACFEKGTHTGWWSRIESPKVDTQPADLWHRNKGNSMEKRQSLQWVAPDILDGDSQKNELKSTDLTLYPEINSECITDLIQRKGWPPAQLQGGHPRAPGRPCLIQVAASLRAQGPTRCSILTRGVGGAWGGGSGGWGQPRGWWDMFSGPPQSSSGH